VHWRGTSRLVRRLYRHRLKKARIDPEYAASRHPGHIWTVLKKQAIERAVGL
jgi:hypothetical protein